MYQPPHPLVAQNAEQIVGGHWTSIESTITPRTVLVDMFNTIQLIYVFHHFSVRRLCIMLTTFIAFKTTLTLLLNFLIFSWTDGRCSLLASCNIQGWFIISSIFILLLWSTLSSLLTKSCASYDIFYQSLGSNFTPTSYISFFRSVSLSPSKGGYPQSST